MQFDDWKFNECKLQCRPFNKCKLHGWVYNNFINIIGLYNHKVGICVIPALTYSKWEFLNWVPMPELSSLIPESPALIKLRPLGKPLWLDVGNASATYIGDFVANLVENAKDLTQRSYHQSVEFLKDIHCTDLDWSHTLYSWRRPNWLQWHNSTQTAVLGLNLPSKA